MLSLYLWTPKWRLWATWSAIFFYEGLYSKWVCMQLYILIIKYLNLKKQKKKLKMKQIIKFIWSWRFVVFNPACLKKDQLDFRNLTDLCVCVYVYEHLSELVKERQRESKKGSTRFSKERERKKGKKVSTRFSTKEKKNLFPYIEKLISLHWKNLFPHFVKTYFPVSTSIQQMALHWSILNFFKVSFIKHTY